MLRLQRRKRVGRGAIKLHGNLAISRNRAVDAHRTIGAHRKGRVRRGNKIPLRDRRYYDGVGTGRKLLDNLSRCSGSPTSPHDVVTLVTQLDRRTCKSVAALIRNGDANLRLLKLRRNGYVRFRHGEYVRAVLTSRNFECTPRNGRHCNAFQDPAILSSNSARNRRARLGLYGVGCNVFRAIRQRVHYVNAVIPAKLRRNGHIRSRHSE